MYRLSILWNSSRLLTGIVILCSSVTRSSYRQVKAACNMQDTSHHKSILVIFKDQMQPPQANQRSRVHPTCKTSIMIQTCAAIYHANRFKSHHIIKHRRMLAVCVQALLRLLVLLVSNLSQTNRDQIQPQDWLYSTELFKMKVCT